MKYNYYPFGGLIPPLDSYVVLDLGTDPFFIFHINHVTA